MIEKNFAIGKIFGSKKISVQKNFGLNNFRFKNFRFENSGSKKISVTSDYTVGIISFVVDSINVKYREGHE